MSSLYPPIIKNTHNANSYPLSFGQERLWLIDKLGSGSKQYNLIHATSIKGYLDRYILEKCLNIIVEKHEILRTIFKLENGLIEQIVLPQLDLLLEYKRFENMQSRNKDEIINSIIDIEGEKIFDLSKGPLLNAILLQTQHDEYVFILNIHHIISDGWSIQLLLQEIVEAYMSFLKTASYANKNLTIQYSDYALWQRDCYKNGVFNDDMEYWKNCLRGAPSLLPLPTEFPRPHIQQFEGNQYRFELDHYLSEGISKVCKQKKVTPFMFLLACYNVLLHYYTSEEDILVGIPSSGRNNYEIENLLGYFINTLIIRTQMSGDIKFSELLNKVASKTLNAYDHQFFPFEKLIEEINPDRDMGHSPLFQVFFSFYNKQFHEIHLNGLEIEPILTEKKSAKFDLSFEIEEYKGRIWIGIEYPTSLFSECTIKNMSVHYVNIISSVIDNPDINVSNIPILTAEEFHKIIFDWNSTETDFSKDKCIHQLVEEQALSNANKTAVIYNEARITYGELNKISDLIAHKLSYMGAEPGDRIAVCMEREINQIAGLLGILKIGCCYIPIDTEMPSERMASIIDDSDPKIIIVQNNTQNRFIGMEKANTVLIDYLTIASPDYNAPLIKTASPNDLAYIMYTSGSTGEPKGVEITHKSVVNFLMSMKLRPGMARTDLLLSVTNYTFDISVLEMFLPLICGAILILIKNGEQQDGIKLKERIKQLKPTIIQATPATWKLLLAAGWEGNAHSLKILCGGEVLDKNLADQLMKRGKEVWNLYGPTETTIWSAIYKLTGEEDEIPIGHPIGNTKIYILDKHLNPVIPGTSGYIYISGAGVAKGYRKRNDETIKKFCHDKFNDSLVMYNTGDKGRYNNDGLIYFLGRADFQLKIRGYRIEAGDIESTIQRYDGISACTIAKHIENNGETSLVAYIEKEENKNIDESDLRRYLGNSLPGYMIPVHYIFMKKFPLTISGKVDRKRLPLPVSRGENIEELKTPKSETEMFLLDIWKNTLKNNSISIDSSFFSLGGNSLLGTVIISQIKNKFYVDLPLKELFENPTIEQLAHAIEIEQIKELNDDDLKEIINTIT